MLESKEKIISYIRKAKAAQARDLVAWLGISSQAVHRHLKALVAEGRLTKTGSPPRVLYSVREGDAIPTRSGLEIMQKCAQIFRRHPQVRLVTLFGSYARGRERAESDIDILVWLAPDAKIGRHEIWKFWDAHASSISWRHQVSIVVTKLAPIIRLHTLLIDLPEEHQVILDRGQYFEKIRAAVLAWRERNGAVKIPSFGGRHAWRYTNQAVRLREIDFDLELGDVA